MGEDKRGSFQLSFSRPSRLNFQGARATSGRGLDFRARVRRTTGSFLLAATLPAIDAALLPIARAIWARNPTSWGKP